MSQGRNRTLYVSGFHPQMRARELAWEFERFGRLVRCDIPAPKNPSSKLFAFVEFEDFYDAEDAYNDMHGRRLDRDSVLDVQWARNTPSSTWRHEGLPRRRSRSPPGYTSSSRGRSRSPLTLPPPRSSNHDKRRSPSPRYEARKRSPNVRDYRRSRSPPPRQTAERY